MRSTVLISIFYLFNCRVRDLWNTNESEWRVLTLNRFLGSACERKPRDRLEFLIRMHVGAPPFFFSLWTTLRSSCKIQKSCCYLAELWFDFLIFFFVLDQGRSVSSAVTKTTSWRVAALSYPHGRIPVGHDFKCMQLKSVSFFFLSPVSVLNHPSSLFYISKKRRKDKIYKHHL